MRIAYSALPKGAYVEDRILQRRERRLASPGKYILMRSVHMYKKRAFQQCLIKDLTMMI